MRQTRTLSPRDVLGHAESRRIFKYGIVGVANVTIDFAVYAILVHAGLGYIAAKTLSLSVATANGYTWNRLWTFRAGQHRHEMMVKYVGVQATCLVLNLALLALLIEFAGLGEITGQVTALPLVAAFSFLVNRFWTFGVAP